MSTGITIKGTDTHDKYLHRVRTAHYFCGTQTGLCFTRPKVAPKESEPIGHRNCTNTSPSHKHCTIKLKGHVEMSETEQHTFANSDKRLNSTGRFNERK